MDATSTPQQAQPTEAAQQSTGYVFARGGRSENSLNSSLANDGDPTTVWVSDSDSAPESAFVWYDLGGRKPVSEIRWLVSEAVPGSTLTIEVSTNRRRWTEVATITDVTPGEWQSVDGEDEETRFIRFTFTNPEGADVIGYLAEVEVLP